MTEANIAEIEKHLRDLRVPEPAITQHVASLKAIRKRRTQSRERLDGWPMHDESATATNA